MCNNLEILIGFVLDSRIRQLQFTKQNKCSNDPRTGGWPYREKRSGGHRNEQQKEDWLILVRPGQGFGTIDNWFVNLGLLLFIRIKAQGKFIIMSIETWLLGEFSCYLSVLNFSEGQIDSFSLVAWNCKVSNSYLYFQLVCWGPVKESSLK